MAIKKIKNMNKASSLQAFKRVGPPNKVQEKNLIVDRPRDLGYSGIMKEIIYKGKKVKVPFEDANYTLDGDKDVTIENRFGGEKCTVPGYAAAVYDVIIGAESFQDWDRHRKGLDWFSRNFPKQYMVLLD